MRKSAILLFLLLLTAHKGSNSGELLQPPVEEPHEVTLVFCGDLMQHMPQVYAARSGDGYDYSGCFRFVAPMWEGADWVIANLETTLSDRRFSGYPCFVSPWQVARDALGAGIGVMVTANNHSCDNGLKGITQTIDCLDSLGVVHTGTFRDSASYRKLNPLILGKNGFRIALLNYTYDTNGIDIPRPAVVSLIDTLQMGRDILRAKDSLATNIVALMHWGEEYQTKPSAAQKELAAWLHGKGVDLVIGSHPHVVQPWEYHISPDADTLGVTVYSLGNFVSNQRKFPTYGGICVKVTLARTPGEEGCRYNMEVWNNYVSLDYKGSKYAVIPETMIDSLPKSQKAEFERLIKSHAALVEGGKK